MFATSNPLLQCVISEQALIKSGYSMSDIKEMTVDEVLLRAYILTGLHFLAESNRGFG